MQSGRIQGVVRDKGFGFIEPRDGSQTVFFHHSAVATPFELLDEGQEVEFEMDRSSTRPRALRVVLLGPLPSTGNFDTRSGGKPRLRIAGRAAESRRPARVAPTDRDSPVAPEFGFVIRLQRALFQGKISSDKGGPEFVFHADDVRGSKSYSQLEPGDYVRFEIVAECDDPKQPQARRVSVCAPPVAVEQPLHLARHPRARRRKPTWKSES